MDAANLATNFPPSSPPPQILSDCHSAPTMRRIHHRQVDAELAEKVLDVVVCARCLEQCQTFALPA